MAAVGTLMGLQDCSWASSKIMMNNPNFCNAINAFDRDRVSADTIAKVRQFTSQDYFTPAEMASKACVAGALSAWVLEIEEYCTAKGM